MMSLHRSRFSYFVVCSILVPSTGLSPYVWWRQIFDAIVYMHRNRVIFYPLYAQSMSSTVCAWQNNCC